MSGEREVRLSPVRLDLKVASKALIRSYGGQEAASELLGRAQSRFSDVGSPNTLAFLTIDEVAELEDRSAGTVGHPLVTRVLARRQGFELVAIPKAAPSGGDLMVRFAKLAKEYGDSASEIGAALADGKVTPDEADAGLREIDELISEAMAVRAMLGTIAGGA